MSKRETILLVFMGMIVLVAIVFRADSSDKDDTSHTITVDATGESYAIADAVSIRFTMSQAEVDGSSVQDLFFNTESRLSFFDTEDFEIYVDDMQVYGWGNVDGFGNNMNPQISYRVNLYDLALLDEAVAEITRLEGASLYVTFFSRDRDALLEEARATALENARSQAEEVAQMTNMRLGEIVTVSFLTSGQAYDVNLGLDYSALLDAAETENLSLRPKPIQINSSVRVTFETFEQE